MIIAVQGTKAFNDYETFMRAMGVALSQESNENVVEVWSAGPHKINSFTAAFCNSVENYLRQKGFRVVFKKLPESYVRENMKYVSYFAFFGNEKERRSSLIASAEIEDVETGIYRF